jgi:hypothetical protein
MGTGQMPIRITRRLWLGGIQEEMPAQATETQTARQRFKEIVHVDNNE